MLNYICLLNILFTPHSNVFSIPMRLVHQFEVRLMSFIPMTQHLYGTCQDYWHFLLHDDCESYSTYLGRLQAALHGFIKLLPPFAIWKGTHSTLNAFPHYTILIYHRLSTIHYSCTSSSSFVPVSKFQSDVLSHPEQWQGMIDEIVSFKVLVLRSWFLFQLEINCW